MPSRSLCKETIQSITWISTLIYICTLPYAHITAIKEASFAILFICILTLHPHKEIRPSSLWISFAIWLIISLLSTKWTVDLEITKKSIWRDAVKGILAFWICYISAYKVLPRSPFQIGVTLSCIIFSTIALFDFSIYKTWQAPHSPPRYDISVTLLAYLSILFLSTKSKEHSYFKIKCISTWIAICLALITGILSGSRSFVLAIILGFLLIQIIHYSIKVKNSAKFFRQGAFFFGTLSLTLVIYSQFNNQRDLVHIDDRKVLYTAVLENAMNSPWTGSGFGHEINQKWYKETFEEKIGYEVLSTATHAHNIFLSYFEQLGLPGVLLIVMLFYGLIQPCYSAVRSSSPDLQRLGCAGLLLILGTFISNTFNFYFARHHLLFFMGLCGILHGWINRANLTATHSSE